MSLNDSRHMTDAEINVVSGAAIEPPPPPPTNGGGLGDIIKDLTTPKPIEDQVIVY